MRRGPIKLFQNKAPLWTVYFCRGQGSLLRHPRWRSTRTKTIAPSRPPAPPPPPPALLDLISPSYGSSPPLIFCFYDTKGVSMALWYTFSRFAAQSTCLIWDCISQFASTDIPPSLRSTFISWERCGLIRSPPLAHCTLYFGGLVLLPTSILFSVNTPEVQVIRVSGVPAGGRDFAKREQVLGGEWEIGALFSGPWLCLRPTHRDNNMMWGFCFPAI